MAIVFPVDDVVDVILSIGDKTANARDFGTPLIIAAHNLNSDVYREYTSLSALAADGFISGTPVYDMARNIFTGKAAPKKVLVGRRGLSNINIFIRNSTVVQGAAFSVRVVVTNSNTLVKYDKTFTSTYASPSLDTAQEIATDLAAKIEADTDIGPLVAASAVSTGGAYMLRVAPVSSNPLQAAGSRSYGSETKSLYVLTTYLDSISTVYDNIKSASNNSFFFILSDENSSTSSITSLASVAEADQKMFVTTYVDQANDFITSDATSATNDFLSTLKSLSYNNTIYISSKPSITGFVGYPASALVGSWASVLPGADTLKGKTLVNTSPSEWTQSEVSFIKSKNGNVYITRGGTGFFEEGVCVSGRFADLTRGLLWLEAKLEEDVFNLIKRKTDEGSKVPYTDAGVQMIASVMEKRLQEAIRNSFLVSYKIYPPLVEEIAENDKANRLLPDLPFEAVVAGAFHTITIRGYLTLT